MDSLDSVEKQQGERRRKKSSEKSDSTIDENAKKVRTQEVYNKTLAQLESTEATKNPQGWYNKNINKHHVMLFIGIICLLIGFIGYLVISGTQAGWCNTNGEGSGCFVKWITSNEDSNGTLNTTTEVVAEFFAIMFIVVGVVLTTYALTLTNLSKTLLSYKQYQALLLLNKAKDADEKAMTDAEYADLAQKMKDDPPTFLKLMSLSVGNDLSLKRTNKQIARDTVTELQMDVKVKDLKKEKAAKKEQVRKQSEDSDSESSNSDDSLL
jgi:hypothetical protein